MHYVYVLRVGMRSRVLHRLLVESAKTIATATQKEIRGVFEIMAFLVDAK
jgi:hypothetical protein